MKKAILKKMFLSRDFNGQYDIHLCNNKPLVRDHGANRIYPVGNLTIGPEQFHKSFPGCSIRKGRCVQIIKGQLLMDWYGS